MFCKECGEEIAEDSRFCEGCGTMLVEAVADGKLTVYGHSQWFLADPRVKIFVAGELIGEVGRDEVAEVPIYKDTSVEFRCAWKRKLCFAQKGKQTKVQVKWNRITGDFAVAQIL